MTRLISILFMLLFIVSCSNSDPRFDSLEEHVDYLIEQNRYEEAIERIHSEADTGPTRNRLLEKAHLNYGFYNMNTFDGEEMRTRMNEALRQFIEVLRINPENEEARTRIDQILQVYDTMPDRQPEPDVLNSLEEIGYNR